MSGSQKVRKSSPCSSAKQGPMRATLPMSSLLRQDSSLRKSKSNSPTLSPTSPWKRISPESMSGQRSPGSLNYKAKSKTLNARSTHSYTGSSVIRRTASLDTIYLNGQWPRESFYMYCGQLLVDKATQTEEWNGEGKLEKLMRHRLQRVTKEAPSVVREPRITLAPVLQAHVMSPHSDHASKSLRQTTRSSTEGLNQEIERLVLQDASTQDLRVEEQCACTPEGHRAPPPELGRATRSVNTQTPAGADLAGSGHSSGGCSVESAGSPVHGSDACPSPGWNEAGKLGTSPHINKFLAREPPDGCEKVSGKCVEDSRQPMADLSKFPYCPLRPCLTLTPSQGSAFYPLHAPRHALAAVNGEVSSGSSPDEETIAPQLPGPSPSPRPIV